MVSAVTSSIASAPMQNAAITQISTPPIPQYRIDAFRTAVAARLRGGATREVLVREQQALAAALADSQFEQKVAEAYGKEVKAHLHQNKAHEKEGKYHPSHDESLHQVQGILHNRIRDAQVFIGLLSDDGFVATAQLEAKQPAPAPKEYDLPQAKKDEIVRRLVQVNDADGAEPAVHVAASALGQRIVHQSLANMFGPTKGPLRPHLVDALARAWPEATAGDLEKLATGWLKARHDPAHSIADGLKENGELYKAAMALCDSVRQPAIASRVPEITINVPAAPAAKLEADSSVAVGV